MTDETPDGDTAGLLDLSWTDRDGRRVPFYVTVPTPAEAVELERAWHEQAVEQAEAFAKYTREQITKPLTADERAILTGDDPRPVALRITEERHPALGSKAERHMWIAGGDPIGPSIGMETEWPEAFNPRWTITEGTWQIPRRRDYGLWALLALVALGGLVAAILLALT